MDIDIARTDEPDTTMRAWVGCLACYNEGRLRGEWVDALEAEDFVPCPVPYHEEYWVMDHDNFGPWLKGECSPMEAQRIATLVAEIEADDVDPRVVAEWMSITGEKVTEWDAPTKEAFQDALYGVYDSVRDFAEDYVDGIGLLREVPEDLRGYFDIDAWARDNLLQDFTWAEVPGQGTYFFRTV